MAISPYSNSDQYTRKMLIEIGKSIVDMPNFNLCTVMSVGRWH